MLCQIDPRLDTLLPVCWFRHGYLFAIMDALRTAYAAAFALHFHIEPNPKGGPSKKTIVYPELSSWQFRFWQDEQSALAMMAAYLQELPAGGEADEHSTAAEYTARTVDRRNAEENSGLAPLEYYPFDVSTPALEDEGSSEDADDYPDEGLSTFDGGKAYQGSEPPQGFQEQGQTPDGSGPALSTSMDGEGVGPIDWEGEEDDDES
ncbi:hypothetical protein CRD59_06985 [Bifidobacterium xylocopae]|uniref:Uncharacterized protein n=2 Tax=Bifidobacterium xylocopae TaxID=2493119 RepID=A0A366KB56_9BIFI|nr:hypothetical protein CRD59_06985 [Bifidobacterium xylocopae]